MKLSRLVTCAAATAFALCMAGAQAARTSFDTQLSNMRFGVLDLTPDDGIAAEYTYSFLSSGYAVHLTGTGVNKTIDDWMSDDGPVHHTVRHGASFATLDANAVFGDMGISGAVHQQLPRGRASAQIFRGYVFTIAPHSVLTLDGHLRQQLEILPAGAAGGGSSDVYITAAALEGSQTWMYHESLLASPAQPGGLIDKDFNLEYRNPTDYAMNIQFGINFGAIASVSPVPEPAAYLMFGAGLLATGAYGRRRRGPAAAQS